VIIGFIRKRIGGTLDSPKSHDDRPTRRSFGLLLLFSSDFQPTVEPTTFRRSVVQFDV
jgi:hypothetical protein